MPSKTDLTTAAVIDGKRVRVIKQDNTITVVGAWHPHRIEIAGVVYYPVRCTMVGPVTKILMRALHPAPQDR